jgi:predicted transposase YdaD
MKEKDIIEEIKREGRKNEERMEEKERGKNKKSQERMSESTT